MVKPNDRSNQVGGSAGIKKKSTSNKPKKRRTLNGLNVTNATTNTNITPVVPVTPIETTRNATDTNKVVMTNTEVSDSNSIFEFLKNFLNISFFRLQKENETEEEYQTKFNDFLLFLSEYKIEEKDGKEILLLDLSDSQKFETAEIINEMDVLFTVYDEKDVQTILLFYKFGKKVRNYKSFFWYTRTAMKLKEEVKKDNENEDFIFGYKDIGVCESCQNDFIEVKVVRTAAADESAKVFYTCSKCRSRKIRFLETSTSIRKDLQALG